jgi:hypothetical protein
MSFAREPLFAGFESRFQRWFTLQSNSWGDAPGCNETAPLALETSGGNGSSSAEGAAFIGSLGHRPRVSGIDDAASPAGAGRFIPERRP